MQAVQSFLKTHNIELNKLHKDPRSLIAASALLTAELAKITSDVFSKACLGDTSTVSRVLNFIPIVPGFVTRFAASALNEGCGNNKAVLIALTLATIASGTATAYVTKKAFSKDQKNTTPVKQKESPSAKLQVAKQESSKTNGATATSPLSPSALLKMFQEVISSPAATSTDSPKPSGDVTPKGKRGRGKVATPTLRTTPSSHSMRLRTPKTPSTPVTVTG